MGGRQNQAFLLAGVAIVAAAAVLVDRPWPVKGRRLVLGTDGSPGQIGPGFVGSGGSSGAVVAAVGGEGERRVACQRVRGRCPGCAGLCTAGCTRRRVIR